MQCPFLGLISAVTQAPLSVTFSFSVYVHAVCVQRWGDGDQGDFTVFGEQCLFWCISALFVSLTRTNRPVADRRRMKWGGQEWMRQRWDSGDPPHQAVDSCWSSSFVYAIALSSSIVDWVVGSCAYQLSCCKCCVVISSASLLAVALSVLQPLGPILFTYRELAGEKRLPTLLENIIHSIHTLVPLKHLLSSSSQRNSKATNDVCRWAGQRRQRERSKWRREECSEESVGEHYLHISVKFQRLHSPPQPGFVPGGNNAIMATTEERPGSQPTNQLAN